jgi:hypothetical protein
VLLCEAGKLVGDKGVRLWPDPCLKQFGHLLEPPVDRQTFCGEPPDETGEFNRP